MLQLLEVSTVCTNKSVFFFNPSKVLYKEKKNKERFCDLLVCPNIMYYYKHIKFNLIMDAIEYRYCLLDSSGVCHSGATKM